MLNKPLLNIIKLFSLRRGKFYGFIRKTTGLSPLNLNIYEQAFIHKSAMIKGKNRKFINNERLEYLGDAILGAIIADELYNHFPNKNEGFLTKTRSRIVNRTLLNEIANNMELNQWVKVQSKINILNTSILGDTLEALIGAIYIDRGYKTCKQFVLTKIISRHIDLSKIAKKDTNYKSLFIEWGQKHKKSVRFITEKKQSTTDSHPIFISSALVDDITISSGEGYSKKEAQQNAAREAIKKVI